MKLTDQEIEQLRRATNFEAGLTLRTAADAQRYALAAERRRIRAMGEELQRRRRNVRRFLPPGHTAEIVQFPRAYIQRSTHDEH